MSYFLDLNFFLNFLKIYIKLAHAKCTATILCVCLSGCCYAVRYLPMLNIRVRPLFKSLTLSMDKERKDKFKVLSNTGLKQQKKKSTFKETLYTLPNQIIPSYKKLSFCFQWTLLHYKEQHSEFLSFPNYKRML